MSAVTAGGARPFPVVPSPLPVKTSRDTIWMHSRLVKPLGNFMDKLNADFWLLASFVCDLLCCKSWHRHLGLQRKDCFPKVFTFTLQNRCFPPSLPPHITRNGSMTVRWLQALMCHLLPHPHYSAWLVGSPSLCPVSQKAMVCPRRSRN